MEYFIDVESKRLVGSLSSTRTVVPEPFVFGDEPDISVTLVEANTTSSTPPWRAVDLNGYSIRLGVGVPGAQPTAGTYTLTFGADTTSNIDFDAAAPAIDSALNALASITAAGGVTVTSLPLGFQIKFDSVGARSVITATTDALYPSSSAYIYESTDGDGSTQEVQVFTLEQNNAAYTELTTDSTGPTYLTTVIREGFLNVASEVQRFTIYGGAIGGTLQLTIDGEETNPIPYNAPASTVVTELEALPSIGANNVIIVGVGTTVQDFTANFSNSLGNIGTITADTSNLTTAGSKTGTISFDTNEFLELLGDNQQVSAIFEIVKFNTTTSKSETILQQPILCRQDVVANTPASSTPLPAYAAASHTHTESAITDLGTAVTLNADTNLVGNGWFLDTDTLSEDDAEKVPSQQSVKAYVDTQIAGLGSSMVFLGSYDANTTDPTDGDVGGTYVVTVAGTGVASFWTTALEVGDVIIQENATATTEADWVVVSRDIIAASETVAGVVELATQAEVNTGTDTTRVVTPDTLSNYSGFPTGTPEGTAILSTGEVGGTKFLREDGDGTCSWQAAAGGLSSVIEDITPQLGGMLDVNGQAIGDGTLELLTFTRDRQRSKSHQCNQRSNGQRTRDCGGWR